MLHSVLGVFTGPDGLMYGAGLAGLLLVAIALPPLLRRRSDPLDRLNRVDDAGGEPEAAAPLKRHGERNVSLARFAAYLEPQDAEEMSQTRLMMIRAGYAHRDAVRTLHAAQALLGIGLMMLGAVYALILVGDLPPQMNAVYIVLPGGVGYYLPRYWVTKRAAARQEEIQNAFPDGLDLLLVCVEAGQSLDQAIIRVAQEIEPTHPALAAEFALVAAEMRAGREKADVLRAMAERCDLQDVSSFVTVLIQSASFGTSIADALRVYSEEMRDKRVMRAEEKANVLPTKLTVGTMLFCLPPLLIILIGPSLFNIAQDLGGM